MVRLEITDATYESLKEIVAASGVDASRRADKDDTSLPEGVGDASDELANAIASLAESQGNAKVLDHTWLVKASKLARLAGCSSHGGQTMSQISLDSLLQGCSIFHEPKPAFVRSPELEATLARIRKQQEEAEYQKMLGHDISAAMGGGGGGNGGPLLAADEWREVNSHLSALFNIGLSLVAVVMATWWGSGPYTAIEVKVALCSCFGLIIVAAEAFLYIRHFDRQKEKEMEKRRGLRGRLTANVAATEVFFPTDREAKDQ
ncbi:unnamed protein product [Parajaminaea phylloscopi]